MKSVTIIDAYVSSKEKEDLLRDCIASCRKVGNDIMVVTHCPLPEDIVKSVNYHIYDSDNRFNDNNSYAFKSLEHLSVYVKARYSHEYPILKSMRNALYFAKALGYEQFIFTEFDLNFSDEDVEKIKILNKELYDTNRDFLFFNPENTAWFVDNTPVLNIYYETIFFGGKLSTFIDILDSYFPKTLEEYNQRFTEIVDGKPNSFEFLFYDAFSPYKDRGLVFIGNVNKYFSQSKINLSAIIGIIHCYIIPGTDNNDYLYISNDTSHDYTFHVYINDSLEHNYQLSNITVGHSFRIISLTPGCTIKVEVLSDGQPIKTYNLQYDPNDRSTYGTYGHVVFHT